MKPRSKQLHLSPTKEDYLRAIFVLRERNQGKVRANQVCKVLGLSKSTVSERLHELMNQKLIKPSFYSSIKFTKKGYIAAKNLTYKHRLIEVFLNRTLKMGKNQVHAEAHKLEHAFSDKVIKRLAKFLHNPKKDPHGELIPKM